MKPEDCGFVSEEVFESYKDKGCLGVFEGTPVYITPPDDKPIKVVYENDWKVESDGNELVFSKRLSEMESENLLMELFGTTDVGILDCSNMTEEEIAEINRIVDEWNSNPEEYAIPIEDWKRLGYTDEEAKELAEASNIYI